MLYLYKAAVGLETLVHGGDRTKSQEPFGTIRPMQIRQFFSGIFTSTVVIYADFIDPFCYLGYHSLKAAAEPLGINLEWRGFELNPDTPPEGYSLETGGNSDLRPAMWASVASLAKTHGLSFPEPQRISNTRQAQLLANFAQKYDAKNPLIERLYQAYFSDLRDIGNSDVLLTIAREFGIEKEVARRAMEDPKGADRLEKFRQEAKHHHFVGMPGYLWKGRRYFGALSTAAWQPILNPNLKESHV